MNSSEHFYIFNLSLFLDMVCSIILWGDMDIDICYSVGYFCLNFLQLSKNRNSASHTGRFLKVQ